MFSSKNSEWETPQTLFNELNNEFLFSLDPCATKKNAKCGTYFTKKDDGLSKDWSEYIVFMNPPYGREIGNWIKKAAESKTIVVGLLPARTDTKWFWDYIYKKPNVKIRFLKGRLKFGGGKNSAPFPSMVVIWK